MLTPGYTHLLAAATASSFSPLIIYTVTLCGGPEPPPRRLIRGLCRRLVLVLLLLLKERIVPRLLSTHALAKHLSAAQSDLVVVGLLVHGTGVHLLHCHRIRVRRLLLEQRLLPKASSAITCRRRASRNGGQERIRMDELVTERLMRLQLLRVVSQRGSIVRLIVKRGLLRCICLEWLLLRRQGTCYGHCRQYLMVVVV